MDSVTVIVASPGLDGAVSAVLVARATHGPFEVLFYDSERLPDFFAPSLQEKLPPFYELVLCALEVMHSNWDGQLIRPRLMEQLRACGRPVRWFGTGRWAVEDRAAVGHIIGEQNLFVSESAPCTAAIVREALLPEGGEYERRLVELASGGEIEGEEEWQGQWSCVISSLKAAPRQLAEAISPLIQARPERLSEKLLERARKTAEENRSFAERAVGEPLPMRESKLVTIEIPPEKHPFWREISGYARAKREAGFCLSLLAGRPLVLLTRAAEVRVDLRRWVRYLTDLVPAARMLGSQEDVVPILVDGLPDDRGMMQELLDVLRDGAHLVQSG